MIRARCLPAIMLFLMACHPESAQVEPAVLCDVTPGYASFEIQQDHGAVRRGAMIDREGVTFRVPPQSYAKRWPDISAVRIEHPSQDRVSLVFSITEDGSTIVEKYEGLSVDCWKQVRSFLETNRLKAPDAE
jgi:hypothetical protein